MIFVTEDRYANGDRLPLTPVSWRSFKLTRSARSSSRLEHRPCRTPSTKSRLVDSSSSSSLWDQQTSDKLG